MIESDATADAHSDAPTLRRWREASLRKMKSLEVPAPYKLYKSLPLSIVLYISRRIIDAILQTAAE